MSQPRKAIPERRVDIYCAHCRCWLYRYGKNGKGALVKCFESRIVVDHTEQKGICPQCQTQFGRAALVRGAPAIKIIGNKARMK